MLFLFSILHFANTCLWRKNTFIPLYWDQYISISCNLFTMTRQSNPLLLGSVKSRQYICFSSSYITQTTRFVFLNNDTWSLTTIYRFLGIYYKISTKWYTTRLPSLSESFVAGLLSNSTVITSSSHSKMAMFALQKCEMCNLWYIKLHRGKTKFHIQLAF